MLSAAIVLVAKAASSQIGPEKLAKTVTLPKDQMRVDSLLYLFARQTGVEFSFNSKKIIPAKKIFVKKGEQTLASCLSQLQKNTGIHFAAIGNHIILLDNPPAATHALDLQVKEPGTFAATKINKPGPNPTPSARVQHSTISANSGRAKDAGIKSNRHANDPGIKNTVLKNPEKESIDRVRPFDPDIQVSNVTGEDPVVNAKPFVSSTAILGQRIALTSRITDPETLKLLKRIIPVDRRNWTLGAGLNGSIPEVYPGLAGIGFDILFEKPLSNKMSFTGRVGYNRFLGEYQNPVPTPDSSTHKNFSNLPVLVGLRYYLNRGLYVSAELGAAIGGGENSTHISWAPSVGHKFYFRKTSLDLSAKFSYIQGTATIPENPLLVKGNYEVWSFHITYNFLNL